jgi:hypothetical protein
MASQRFSKLVVVLLLFAGSATAQTVVRADTQGTPWAATMFCPNASFVTPHPTTCTYLRRSRRGRGRPGPRSETVGSPSRRAEHRDGCDAELLRRETGRSETTSSSALVVYTRSFPIRVGVLLEYRCRPRGPNTTTAQSKNYADFPACKGAEPLRAT